MTVSLRTLTQLVEDERAKMAAEQRAADQWATQREWRESHIADEFRVWMAAHEGVTLEDTPLMVMEAWAEPGVCGNADLWTGKYGVSILFPTMNANILTFFERIISGGEPVYQRTTDGRSYDVRWCPNFGGDNGPCYERLADALLWITNGEPLSADTYAVVMPEYAEAR